jgi:hypothetical protein
MFVLEEPKSKKRQRSLTHSEDIELLPTKKKQKSASESRSQPRHRVSSFWNSLSRVWLTRVSVKGFDPRHIQEVGQRYYTPLPNSNSPNGQTR